MLNHGTKVRVAGFQGVACTVIGPETRPGESEWFDQDTGELMYDPEPEPVETGRITVIMVGDDHRYHVDPEDCTPIGETDYCTQCGQIGCPHGARP